MIENIILTNYNPQAILSLLKREIAFYKRWLQTPPFAANLMVSSGTLDIMQVCVSHGDTLSSLAGANEFGLPLHLCILSMYAVTIKFFLFMQFIEYYSKHKR